MGHLKGKSFASYGWKWRGSKGKKKLVADEKERKIIGWIMDLRDRHNMTFYQIAALLKRTGVRYRRGGKYHAWSWKRVRQVYRTMKERQPDWLVVCSPSSSPEETPTHPDQTSQEPDHSDVDRSHTPAWWDQMIDNSRIAPFGQQIPPPLG